MMLNISKGEWKWFNGCSWWRLGTIDTNGINRVILRSTNDSDGHPNLICSKEDKKLIAEAGNVAQECGLMPRELLEERDRMKKQLEAYKEVFEEYIPADKMDEANNKILDLCDEAAQAMGKRFCG